MYTSAALLLALASIATGQVLQNGVCPEFNVVPNFDPVAYSGLWYEIAAYPEIFEEGGECSTAEYTVQDDGSVFVRNTMVVGNFLIYVEGTAQQVGTEGIVVVTFVVNGETVLSQLNILETDYNSYAVAASCSDNADGTRNVSAWVLSRNTTLADAGKEALNRLIDEVEGLDHDTFEFRSHDLEVCESIFTAEFD